MDGCTCDETSLLPPVLQLQQLLDALVDGHEAGRLVLFDPPIQ